jgi:hypothetical protein
MNLTSKDESVAGGRDLLSQCSPCWGFSHENRRGPTRDGGRRLRCPQFLYALVADRVTKYVFVDQVRLGLKEAYEHAVHLHHTKGVES